jgi:8-oxo-dGTP pyrophosphatase MutT (NUDIX family)
VLLVQHRHGQHWSFPKGHAEIGEDPWQTAQRELLEETGLYPVRRLSESPLCETYFVAAFDGCKTVDYFLAEVKGVIALQEAEISNAHWCPMSQAASLLTFPEARALHTRACKVLKLCA